MRVVRILRSRSNARGRSPWSGRAASCTIADGRTVKALHFSDALNKVIVLNRNDLQPLNHFRTASRTKWSRVLACYFQNGTDVVGPRNKRNPLYDTAII